MDETGVVKYDITDAAIAEMENLYMGLTITDLEDQEQFDQVHSARMVVKGHRVDLDKAVKAYNDQANNFKKKVKADAAPLYDRLKPMECHLMTEEQKVIDEQKRIQEEKDQKVREEIQRHIDQLRKYGVVMSFEDVAMMEYDEYCSTLAGAKEAHETEQKRLADEKVAREAEEKRLADEKRKLKIRTMIQSLHEVYVTPEMDSDDIKELIDKYKIGKPPGPEFEEFQGEAIQVYQKALTTLTKMHGEKVDQEERDQIEQEKQERIAKEQAEAQAKIAAANAKIEADRKALEDEKRAEAEKKEREAFEKKAAENARIKAEKDAQERVEREAREKAEKEEAEKAEAARQEALKPDKVKLLDYADQIKELSDFALKLKNKAATVLLAETIEALYDLEAEFRAGIERL